MIYTTHLLHWLWVLLQKKIIWQLHGSESLRNVHKEDSPNLAIHVISHWIILQPAESSRYSSYWRRTTEFICLLVSKWVVWSPRNIYHLCAVTDSLLWLCQEINIDGHVILPFQTDHILLFSLLLQLARVYKLII